MKIANTGFKLSDACGCVCRRTSKNWTGDLGSKFLCWNLFCQIVQITRMTLNSTLAEFSIMY